VELEDEALLVGGDAAAAEARVEVVDPPETAALAGAPQTCSTPTRMHREEKQGEGRRRRGSKMVNTARHCPS
jgi:hypothetical protein